jgi:hypothetical protein
MPSMTLKYDYQPISNIVKDGKGGLVTYSHSILVRWRNHFSQLLYVHEVIVTQREIHTSDPLVPEPSTFDVEMAMKKLQRHKSLGTDQIPADLIKAGGKTLHSEFQKLTNSVRKKEEMPEGDKTACSNVTGLSLWSPTCKILFSILLSRLIPYTEKIIGNNQCGL